MKRWDSVKQVKKFRIKIVILNCSYMKKLCKKCVDCYLPQGLLQSVFATVLFLIIKNGKENRDDKIL